MTALTLQDTSVDVQKGNGRRTGFKSLLNILKKSLLEYKKVIKAAKARFLSNYITVSSRKPQFLSLLENTKMPKQKWNKFLFLEPDFTK